MAQVTLVLTDTPNAGVAVHTTYTPAIGAQCTPAQARSLDMTRLALREGDSVSGGLASLEAQRDVLARLLARCIDPLNTLLAESGADPIGLDELHTLIEQAEAVLQHLATDRMVQAMTGKRRPDAATEIAA